MIRLCIAATLAGHAIAADAEGWYVSAEAGKGQSVEVLGVGLGWGDLHRWDLGPKFNIGLSLLGRADHWHGEEENPVVQDVSDFSISPVARLEPTEGPLAFLFLDLGIGVHYITDTRINQQRMLSTHFQFGEFIGPGVRIGKFDVSFRLQHESNGNVKEPNNGLTFRTLAVQYHFQ